MFASAMNDDSTDRKRHASDEYQRMQAAFERVSDMPENRRDSWGDMLELRQAVEKYLQRW